jgi:hypothetical protein
MTRSGLSIQGLAKSVAASAGKVDATAESLRKRLASVLCGRQHRMRRAELRGVAKVLRVKLEAIIQGDRLERRHPAEVEAARVRDLLREALPSDLVVQIDASLEQLLTFDAWHQALGRSAMDASSRRLSLLQVRFAHYLSEAILCLFKPVERGGRRWSTRLLGILVQQILSARERQLNVVRKRDLLDLSGFSVKDYVIKNRRRIRNNQEAPWEEPGAAGSADVEGGLPVSHHGSGESMTRKSSRRSRRR